MLLRRFIRGPIQLQAALWLLRRGRTATARYPRGPITRHAARQRTPRGDPAASAAPSAASYALSSRKPPKPLGRGTYEITRLHNHRLPHTKIGLPIAERNLLARRRSKRQRIKTPRT